MLASSMIPATAAEDWQPILIVGVGRSGTSLIQSMLGSHSQVCFPPETQFLRKYIATGMLQQLYLKGGLPAVRTELENNEQVARLSVDLGEVLQIFKADDVPFSDEAVYRALLNQYVGTTGKSQVGDKDPRSIEYLPLVHRLWPRAFVVHVIRDPRDVLASKKKAAWSRHRPVWGHIFANSVQLAMGRELGPKLFGPRYVEVIYEQLLESPEQVLTDVCAALQLEFEPEMLNFAATAQRLVSAAEMSWKSETLGPLLTQNCQKWKQSLAGWEVALTESACHEALSAGNYACANGHIKLPSYQRHFLNTCGLGLRALGPFYRAYRNWTIR